MDWNPVTSIFKAIISPVTQYMEGKQEIKKGNQEIHRAVVAAKVKRINEAQSSDIEIDKIERQNAGWMDDVSFAIFLIPAVLAFYPPALIHITAGFTALTLMPQWYQAALGMMLVSVWGYRKLVGPIIGQIVSKSLLGKK